MTLGSNIAASCFPSGTDIDIMLSYSMSICSKGSIIMMILWIVIIFPIDKRCGAIIHPSKAIKIFSKILLNLFHYGINLDMLGLDSLIYLLRNTNT